MISAPALPSSLAQSWQDRLSTWTPAPNPALLRCPCCGLLPTTHRDYCPGCGVPV